MLDFGALPPEINSGRMYAGPGAGPMLAAATAWDVLAAQLYSTASSYSAAIMDLAASWLGPSSIAMAAAAAPYVSWIGTTAAQAEATGMQAKAAVAAYEAAFAMTVPPPVIAANRALLMMLIATNFFGQNTPAIMATEAHYMEMWAQDAAAMFGYAAASQTASTFTPFMPPLPSTNPAGLAGQAAAVGQAAATSAGTSAQTVSPLTSAMSMPLAATTPLTASSTSSSAGSPVTALTGLTTSSTALTSGASLASGTGSSASLGASGASMFGSAGSLMRTVGPAVSMFGTNFSAVSPAFGSSSGALASPSLGSAAVTAGLGRATSVGTLSVPQSWASAAPAFNPVATSLPATTASAATPAVGAANPGGMLGAPLAPLAGRSGPTPAASIPRLGFRPTVVQHPVYAG
ncbi:PPE family protein [uncultured Mycobacterium sp.]|uniref:PPE family protein n=1 Tax=uncultured Mycobacterium sp. TaxID=171292 RepID=UPI0035C993C4